MSLSASLAVSLANMPSLAELFRLFLSGKHLNRLAEPTLWAELEKQEADYSALFAALGYELRIDARGFAWFHTTEANSNIGKTSRQLALLFMVIFEAQANAGKPLLRFGDWLIDREKLAGTFPPLAGNRAVTMRNVSNLVQVVRRGGFLPATEGNPQPYGMPPFGHLIDDADIAAVLSYVRGSWGNAANWAATEDFGLAVIFSPPTRRYRPV